MLVLSIRIISHIHDMSSHKVLAFLYGDSAWKGFKLASKWRDRRELDVAFGGSVTFVPLDHLLGPYDYHFVEIPNNEMVWCIPMFFFLDREVMQHQLAKIFYQFWVTLCWIFVSQLKEIHSI